MPGGAHREVSPYPDQPAVAGPEASLLKFGNLRRSQPVELPSIG
jgi:hypothetical protein